MPGRLTVSPMIKEGHYDWILRIDTPVISEETKLNNMFYRKQESKKKGGNYFIYNYDKKEYTLDQVMEIRNEKILEFEKMGLRKAQQCIKSNDKKRLDIKYDIPVYK
jgi:hypothetical protein